MFLKMSKKAFLIFCCLIFVSLELGSTEGEEVFTMPTEYFVKFLKSVNNNTEFIQGLKYNDWNFPFVCWQGAQLIIPIKTLVSGVEIDGSLLEKLHSSYNIFKNNHNEIINEKLKPCSREELLSLSIECLTNQQNTIREFKKIFYNETIEPQYYIFDFSDKLNNKLEVYYFQSQEFNYSLLKKAEKPITNSKEIERWSELLKKKNEKITAKFSLTFLKCDWNAEVNSRVISNIVFGNCDEKYFENVYSIRKSLLMRTINFEFKIDNVEDDFIKLKTRGIWINDTTNGLFISPISICNYIDETNIFAHDKKINLYFAKTRDFSHNAYILPDAESTEDPEQEKSNEYKIVKNDLTDIIKFIINIVSKRKSETKIRLIGYADISGKKKLGETEWRSKNAFIAEKRAENIKLLLENALIKYKIVFEYEGCEEYLYENNFRHVDIIVF